MSTRLYQPISPGAVNPIANGTWGVPLGASSKMSPVKLGTAQVQAAVSWTAAQTAEARVSVSSPLVGSGTLAGTLKAYALALSPAAANARARLEAYIVDKAGTTIRGTLLSIADYSTGTGYNTTLRNKAWADGDALTPVNWVDGDRIVVKWGYTDAAGTTPQATSQFGDVIGSTDAGSNETDTTASLASWLEFSQTLAFYESQVNVLDTGSTVTANLTLGTNSKTTTGGAVQLLWVENVQNAGPPTCTVTGLGLTWVQVFTQVGVTSARMTLFRALSPSAQTGALTITFSSSTTRPWYHWVEVTNVDQSGSNGSGAIAQSLGATNGGTITSSESIVLGSTSTKPDSFMLAMFSSAITPPAYTARSGWALQNSFGGGGGATSSLYARATFEQTASVTFTGSFTAGQAIAGIVEINVAPAPFVPAIVLSSPALGTIAAATPIVIAVTDGDGDLSTVEIKANGVTVRTGAAAGAFSTGFTSSPSSTNSSITNGRSYSFLPDAGVWAGGALGIVVTAVDVRGNSVSQSFAFTVSLGSPPVNTRNSPALGSIAVSAAIDLSVTDPDTNLDTVLITANGTTVHTGAATGALSAGFTSLSTNTGITNGRQYVIRPDSGAWATGALVVIVTGVDTLGNTTTTPYTWTVSAGSPPVVTRNSPALGSVAGTVAIDLSITDPDTNLDTVLITANGVTVHTGVSTGALSTGFTTFGTNTGITGGRQYVFRPDAGVWATGALTVVVTAVDTLGNVTTTSYTWTVTAPATVAPVITRVSPALTAILPAQVLTVKGTDADGDLTLLTASITFPTLGTTETVYDGSGFLGVYAGSTVTPLTGPNGSQLGIARTGGWPDAAGLTLSLVAVDAAGHLVPASFTWPSVTFPAPPPALAVSDAPIGGDAIGFDIQIDETTRRWVRTKNGDIARTVGVDAIVQAVRQAVRTFLGEYFLDLTVGIDWFGSILGIKDPDLNAIRAQIRVVILSVKGVTNVTQANITLDPVARHFSIFYSATGDVGQLIADEFTVNR